MATFTLPQSLVDSMHTRNVDMETFMALEKRVDHITAKLAQVAPGRIDLRGLKPNHFPKFAVHALPMTTETSSAASPRPSLAIAPENILPSTPDVDLPEPATLGTHGGTAISDRPSEKLALQILDIIQMYGHNVGSGNSQWAGKAKFMPIVEAYVVKNEPVKMVLPAFPCKSPNRVGKVLGSMPDLGEELALMHLNGLCESVAEIYGPGARVVITSDGLVYNDLMGIEDSEVWNYATAVRGIIRTKELNYLDTLRIVDLLGHPNTEMLTKEEYVHHAGCYRRELIARFAVEGFDSDKAVREDADTCMTYNGYIKFLHKDLKHSQLAGEILGQEGAKRRYNDLIQGLALKMIERGRTFAAAIASKLGDHVRLSIHPSVGKTKLSVPLIPNLSKGFSMTPWHSAIVVGIDGSFRTVHAADVRDTHDLIFKNGLPHHFREKSDLWDLANIKVDFEHLYPCGLVIRPAPELTVQPSIREVDGAKFRKLAEANSPVILRGFAETTERNLFVGKAHEIGKVLHTVPWTPKVVQEVKDSKKFDKGSNNVTSSEAMPMHYDGVFKFVNKKDRYGNDVKDEQGDDVKVPNPPAFQFFTSIATAPKGTGYTLFASSRLFWQHLPAPWTLKRFEAVRWRMSNSGFWDNKMKDLPLVLRHPKTDLPCVRWHQPWPASKTKFSTCAVSIENDRQEIIELVDRMLYDRRVCLRFTWEKGDLLLADNHAMMHTRTAFTGDCERELWRIHID